MSVDAERYPILDLLSDAYLVAHDAVTAVLRPLGLGYDEWPLLRLLAQRPAHGPDPADLLNDHEWAGRGYRNLQSRGLVLIRHERVQLTADGFTVYCTAREAVAAVESRIFEAIPACCLDTFCSLLAETSHALWHHE